MKRISTAVLTAALVTGMAGVTFAPEAFAKKKEEAKPTGPQVSPAVGASIQKAKAAFAAKDMAAAEVAVAEVEAGAKTEDEKYFGNFLRYALVSQKIADASTGTNGAFDPTPMIGPLDALIASPSTPADLRPQFEYSRATIAYDQKNWALASQLFAAAQTHGSTQQNLPLYLAKAKVQGGNAAGGMADLDVLYASGKPQTEDFYKYAISQSNTAGLKAETLKWLQRWVTAYPTSTTWRTAIAFYGFSAKPMAKLDKRQQVDLFRLMRQSKALADQADYEEYAQRSIDIGLPDEAKLVIDEGKATGKIPAASSSTIKGLSSDAATQIAAEGSFDALERKATASPTGPLSAQTGDAYLGRSNYAKAIALYRQALSKGGVNADEVNTHLGIALAMSGDKAGAKTAFATVTGAPRSDIAAFWTIWLDHPPTS
jgi:tetratricopeptide (TPR) repeat protein